MSTTASCPRCTRPYEPRQAALSRTDNQTRICPPCGTDEAMMGWAGRDLPGPALWPLEHRTPAWDGDL